MPESPEDRLRKEVPDLIGRVREAGYGLGFRVALVRLLTEARERGVLAKDVASPLVGAGASLNPDLYYWAGRLEGALERADRDAPGIVPDLQAEIASLDNG